MQESQGSATDEGNRLAQGLAAQGYLVLDGALATELERRGADLRDALWSAKLLIEAPEMIRKLHYDYLAAGADVVITASYQATFEGFARRGIGHEAAAELMRLSVRLAIEARDAFWSEPANRTGRIRPLVAASVGPYGAFLANGSEYRGDYGLSKEQLMVFHRLRLAVLATAGADLLACETIPCLAEGAALARLMPEFPSMQAWLSFSCCDGERVCHGEPYAEVVAAVEGGRQVAAVGVNCTAPQYIESLIREARGVTANPIVVYPNSGERWDAAARCWVPGAGGTNFGEAALAWRAAGASLIGGCCRSGPEDIAAIRVALDSASLSD